MIDDEIRKMLNDAYENINKKNDLDYEINVLSKEAEENAFIVFKLIYKKTIDSYQNDPLRRSPFTYGATIELTPECKRNDGKIHYTYDKGQLAHEHNLRHDYNERITFLNPYHESIGAIPFKCDVLERMLLDEGFVIAQPTYHSFSASMDADEFRSLIKKTYQKRR